MTILPVKKKRDKDGAPKTASGSSIEASRPTPAQPAAGVKRPRPEEFRRRWAVSPTERPASSRHSPPPRNLAGPSCSEPRPSSPSADYNSDDEYQLQNLGDDSEQAEIEFADRLAARGLIIKEMVGDGACMFRAIAEQIYGDQDMHGQIRQLCMDYMANNRDHFQEFITENYESYIRRKREEHVHGNHVELQAISEMFARPVEVYQYSAEPINVLLPRPDPAGAEGAAAPLQQNAPLRLSYHRNVHYNAILAPNVPTIGVGLGLPGMIPGSADKDIMSKAIAKSELEQIEEAMLQDKIGMTDFQRTQADLDEQIARESMLSYFQDLEKARSGASTSGEGPSTSSASTAGPSEEPPKAGLYEELLAAQTLDPDWESYAEETAIADALLLSQQDYLMQNRPGTSGSNNTARRSPSK